jgi:hypothetical protein
MRKNLREIREVYKNALFHWPVANFKQSFRVFHVRALPLSVGRCPPALNPDQASGKLFARRMQSHQRPPGIVRELE